jgi:phosphoglycolate phosphatase-like HAD superfamily hydrolase
MKPILLFDIDGTLLHVKKSFLLKALSDILKEQGISPDILNSMSFAGRTDRDIFNELITFSEFNSKDQNREHHFHHLKNAYLHVMLDELNADAVSLIDDVSETLHYLKESGYHLGLCTGNFKEIAYKKVISGGFEGFFEFGGFGCDHADRIHLPNEAHTSYIAYSGSSPSPNEYLVIGDTPNDIRCARHFGARVIAVTTGGHSQDELKSHSPDLVLSSLKNPEEWLELV